MNVTRSSGREREQENMRRVIHRQVQQAREKERGRVVTGREEGESDVQRVGASEKKKLRMMTSASAREDKFSLMSQKTKTRMIKRAPYVKMIAEI